MRLFRAFLMITVFLSVITFPSCMEDDDLGMELQLRSPYDRQWKLEGFGPVSTTSNAQFSSSAVKPAGENTYLLVFRRDGTFEGTSSTNEITGTFTINLDRGLLSIDELGGTKKGEIQDGERYVWCLKQVKYYTVYENTLQLFYTDDKTEYLLYKAVN